MADHSAIQWTDATWNPTTGCTKVSPGCAHCYIEHTTPFRIAGNRFEHGKTDLMIFHDRLAHPLHWRKPRRVFVNSLSDLFHEDIGDAFIDQVFAVMAEAGQHTFQVLTKRAERMRDYIWHGTERRGWPLPNVWLGVSVENQHFADERIPLLLETRSAVRFISAEPLLGPVDLSRFIDKCSYYCDHGEMWPEGHRPERGLDWVIVGGESGPGARPFEVAWARSIVHQCRAAGVACFVKQLGSNPAPLHVAAGSVLERLWLRDKKGGDIEEWPQDLRVREFPSSGRADAPPPASAPAGSPGSTGVD